MNNLENLSAIEIAQLIKDNAVTADKVYDFFKQRIETLDNKIKSFVEVYDTPVSEINPLNSPLQGIPIAIKDNICIKDKKITCAAKILANYQAPYDATVINKLKLAGLNIVGTTNMDEFAFGSSTENSCYGPTKNPWDLTRVPGGSSGGSAGAVAARLVPFALGSDTGGSIRQPAAFCGVVGFKPTYGRISRYGLIAFGSSLDQIGPITTNFVDCAYLLNILCGADDYDSTLALVSVPDFSKSLQDNIQGIKIGLPKEYFIPGVDNCVNQKIKDLIKLLESKGAIIKDISLPHTQYAVAAYYIIGSSEASSNLERFDSIKYGLRIPKEELKDMYEYTRSQGFGYESKRRILLGTHSLSSGYYDAYYIRALKVRSLIKNDFDQAFKEVDVILTPTTPTPAFKIGEKVADPLSMYLSDIFTISANLGGNPAVSFPCGFSKDGLPIGAQFIGRHFDEEMLIRLGFSYQASTDFHKKIPTVNN